MEKLLNQKVHAHMKMQDLKLEDFNRRLDEVKSAEKSAGEIVKDLTLGKARSILFEYLLANWYSIVVFFASLLGLAEAVKEHLANLEELRNKVYSFINQTVKRLEEFDGKMRDIITKVKDFQARVEKLEKEQKNSTSGEINGTLKDFQARVEKLEKELKNLTSGGSSAATTPGGAAAAASGA